MHEFMNFMKLDLLVSIPQTLVIWLFCFSFLETRPKNLYKRIAILSVIHSVYTDTLILVLPLHLHLINTVVSCTILLIIIFKEIHIRTKLLLVLFAFFVSMCMDLISAGIAIHILEIPTHADMIRDHLFQMITVIYPQMILLLVTSWFIYKKNLFSTTRFLSTVMKSERSVLTKVIVLISVQFILLGLLQVFLLAPNKYDPVLNAILIYALIFVSLSAIVSIIRLLVRTRDQAVRMTQEVYVEEINEMFTSIRGQRHDFLNHVQVIHTMLQMGKTDQLKSYVADLVKETRDVSDIVHHSSPAIAAFVQAKMTISIGKEIAFTYELLDKWNTNETTIKLIDIIKIMGNLVDNAFDETEKLPTEQRFVHASIAINDDNRIELQVSNTGHALEAKDKERLFIPGYTTKGTGHSGLGLAIVQERVKHYNGNIELHSDVSKRTTSFLITLPLSTV